MFDRKHYTPVIRRGTTATPIQLDYDGRPAFLIDVSVFPGSSGSPVFSYDLAINGNIAGIRLLGILAEVFCRTEVGEVRSLPAPTSTSFVALQQMIDLGVVFKSHLILETINDFWIKNGEVMRRIKKEKASNNGSDRTARTARVGCGERREPHRSRKEPDERR
jgi:hypothetical protein